MNLKMLNVVLKNRKDSTSTMKMLPEILLKSEEGYQDGVLQKINLNIEKEGMDLYKVPKEEKENIKAFLDAMVEFEMGKKDRQYYKNIVSAYIKRVVNDAIEGTGNLTTLVEEIEGLKEIVRKSGESDLSQILQSYRNVVGEALATAILGKKMMGLERATEDMTSEELKALIANAEQYNRYAVRDVIKEMIERKETKTLIEESMKKNCGLNGSQKKSILTIQLDMYEEKKIDQVLYQIEKEDGEKLETQLKELTQLCEEKNFENPMDLVQVEAWVNAKRMVFGTKEQYDSALEKLENKKQDLAVAAIKKMKKQKDWGNITEKTVLDEMIEQTSDSDQTYEKTKLFVEKMTSISKKNYTENLSKAMESEITDMFGEEEVIEPLIERKKSNDENITIGMLLKDCIEYAYEIVGEEESIELEYEIKDFVKEMLSVMYKTLEETYFGNSVDDEAKELVLMFPTEHLEVSTEKMMEIIDERMKNSKDKFNELRNIDVELEFCDRLENEYEYELVYAGLSYGNLYPFVKHYKESSLDEVKVLLGGELNAEEVENILFELRKSGKGENLVKEKNENIEEESSEEDLGKEIESFSELYNDEKEEEPEKTVLAEKLNAALKGLEDY